MDKDKMLSALKNAMKGELESITVYQNAMSNSDDKEVIEFFENRIEEEKKHYNYLIGLYQAITNYTELKPVDMDKAENQVFSKNFAQKIAGNHLLFSAISVATMLEKKAFDYYQKAAMETEDEVLRSFFEKMAFWEKHHYDVLLDIYDTAKKTFWSENRFEPF